MLRFPLHQLGRSTRLSGGGQDLMGNEGRENLAAVGRIFRKRECNRCPTDANRTCQRVAGSTGILIVGKIVLLTTFLARLRGWITVMMIATVRTASHRWFYALIILCGRAIFAARDMHPSWRLPKGRNDAKKCYEKMADIKIHCKNSYR